MGFSEADVIDALRVTNNKENDAVSNFIFLIEITVHGAVNDRLILNLKRKLSPIIKDIFYRSMALKALPGQDFSKRKRSVVFLGKLQNDYSKNVK